MKLNPWTFLYCAFYKFLENKTREKDRISFSVQAFIAIGLIIYLVITAIVIKSNFNISLGLKFNKYIIGVCFSIIYFVINYIMFDRDNRYLKLLTLYCKTTKIERLIHISFWMLIILIPLILNE
jgi:hypothetical protein